MGSKTIWDWDSCFDMAGLNQVSKPFRQILNRDSSHPGLFPQTHESTGQERKSMCDGVLMGEIQGGKSALTELTGVQPI